jgi:hypothetical protein
MRGRAADCTTAAELVTESGSAIRYAVWCGAQNGRVTLRIRRPHGSAPHRFSPTARASGPGAAGPLHCDSRGDRVLCSGWAHGAVTFRGKIEVAVGSRCSTKLLLNVWRWTGDTLSYPVGCPHAYSERERTVGEILYERSYRGLDRDLAGHHAAKARRAESLLAAWHRGNPVARWGALEEAFRMPLFAPEQVELEYRETYRRAFQRLIGETDWIAENAPSTYAGYEIDEAAGGIIYVGFTAEPEASLNQLKKRLIAPDRFRPFPVTPTYTLAELEKLWLPPEGHETGSWKLVNGSSIDALANKVELTTEHVARVRRMIAKEYGPEAPFEVIYGRPPVPF